MRLEDVYELGSELGLSRAILESCCKPAIRLAPTRATTGFSRLGGMPDLPLEVEWPVFDTAQYDAAELKSAKRQGWKERAAEIRASGPRGLLPLSFLAQLDLRDLSHVECGLPLPKEGFLWFFFELTEQPWGYCPSHRGSFRVLWADADTAREPRKAPEGAEVSKSTRVEPSASWSFDGWPDLTDEEFEAYDSLRQTVQGDGPAHQVGGRPEEIQGDMAGACALVTKGVYLGSPPRMRRRRLERLAADAVNWRLLLQLDSDDDLGWMWGDAGMLYWWMREQDIQAGAWDRAWFQLQCG